MDIAYHFNPTQPHQIEHGQWLKAGFKKHGLELIITPSIHQQADIHIVSGPHYAKNEYVGHENTILLDRAYWHELKSGKWVSMDYVSLGWMRRDGGRRFRTNGTNRVRPVITNQAAQSGTIFLADYGGTIEEADTVRRHPGDGNETESLDAALKRHKTAIGYTTTALIRAGLYGLDVICRDRRSIMYEPNWLDLLAYTDWKYSEIESGDAWEHLKNDINTGNSPRD